MGKCNIIGNILLVSSLCVLAQTTSFENSRRARLEDTKHPDELGAAKSDRVRDEPPLYYLLDHCHKMLLYYFYKDNKDEYIPVSSSIRLKLDRERNLDSNHDYNCYATIISARPNHKLMLHFNNVNIHSKYLLLHERLHIFDGSSKKALTPPLGLFGNFSNEPGVSSDRRLMDFLSQGPTLFLYFKGMTRYSSFDAVITTYTDSVNGTCSPGYFLCKKSHFCIQEELQCDGQSNCGVLDQSDEQDCYRMSDDEHYGQQIDTENIGLVVGTAICTLFLLIVVMWISIICIKRAIMKRDLRRLLREMANSQSRPVAPDPSMVCMAPPPGMVLCVPPPVYSEQQRSEESPEVIELPPPYWAATSGGRGADTERLIPHGTNPTIYDNNNSSNEQQQQQQRLLVNETDRSNVQHNNNHRNQRRNFRPLLQHNDNADMVEVAVAADGRIGIVEVDGSDHHWLCHNQQPANGPVSGADSSATNHPPPLSLFSPMDSLPKYTSHDDLPTYATATQSKQNEEGVRNQTEDKHDEEEGQQQQQEEQVISRGNSHKNQVH